VRETQKPKKKAIFFSKQKKKEGDASFLKDNKIQSFIAELEERNRLPDRKELLRRKLDEEVAKHRTPIVHQPPVDEEDEPLIALEGDRLFIVEDTPTVPGEPPDEPPPLPPFPQNSKKMD
jgi:hypothetical protein